MWKKLYWCCITDINECEEAESCQQNCTNTKGSFECGCTVGYMLQNDGKSCKGG